MEIHSGDTVILSDPPYAGVTGRVTGMRVVSGVQAYYVQFDTHVEVDGAVYGGVWVKEGGLELHPKRKT